MQCKHLLLRRCGRLFAIQDADLTGVVIGISSSAACGRVETRVGVSHYATKPHSGLM